MGGFDLDMDSKKREAEMVEQLREQVGNLMAAAQLLTPAIREQEERKYDQYLAILNQGLYRLLRLTEHVDLSRQEELPCRTQTVEAMELCRVLCRELEGLTPGLGIGFRGECAGGEALVKADPAMLRRLLLLLVDQALYRAGRNGHIGLRAWSEGERFRVTVWDDGEAALPGGKRTATLEECLTQRGGLELDLARSIARAHGATLVFEQGEEQGSRAVLSLPLGEMESQGLHTPRMGYNPTGGLQPALVELSDLLPYQAYLWDELE